MNEDAFDFMRIWTQYDEESEREMQAVLLEGLDKAVRAQSDALSRIRLDRPIAGPVVRWMEEWGYPSSISARLVGNALTIEGPLFGKPPDPASVGKVIREGAILERPRDGCQVKVTSVARPFALVEAYGNTALADDPGPVDWDIIAEVWSDYRDAAGPRSLDRTFREVGTPIFAETFEIPKTRANTRYHMVPQESEHQILALLGKLRRHLGYAVLRSRPLHDGSQFVWGDRTDEPTLCGLLTWPAITQAELANPRVYVNKAGMPLGKKDLDDLVRHLWLDEHADYHRGDWWIVCHPVTHQFIHDFDVPYRKMGREDTASVFA